MYTGLGKAKEERQPLNDEVAGKWRNVEKEEREYAVFIPIDLCHVYERYGIYEGAQVTKG